MSSSVEADRVADAVESNRMEAVEEAVAAMERAREELACAANWPLALELDRAVIWLRESFGQEESSPGLCTSRG